jgi:hypothetical protein
MREWREASSPVTVSNRSDAAGRRRAVAGRSLRVIRPALTQLRTDQLRDLQLGRVGPTGPLSTRKPYLQELLQGERRDSNPRPPGHNPGAGAKLSQPELLAEVEPNTGGAAVARPNFTADRFLGSRFHPGRTGGCRRGGFAGPASKGTALHVDQGVRHNGHSPPIEETSCGRSPRAALAYLQMSESRISPLVAAPLQRRLG